MRRALFRSGQLSKRLASFTLVELLAVIGIIAILCALVLEAGSGIMQKAMRARATNEIAGMSAALEGYKTDNGIYPPSDGVLMTNNYASSDGSLLAYQTNSTLLFIALTGTNYSTAITPGTKYYMTFKASQIANPGGPYSYIKDPWGYSYGYSTATNAAGATPYNGNNFFDLWSTSGLLKAKVNTNSWIVNW